MNKCLSLVHLTRKAKWCKGKGRETSLIAEIAFFSEINKCLSLVHLTGGFTIHLRLDS
jgi:hypothetical protein